MINYEASEESNKESKIIGFYVDRDTDEHEDYESLDTYMLLLMVGRLNEYGRQVSIDQINAVLQKRLTATYTKGSIQMVDKWMNNNN
jgi:hypothetical protein